MARENLPESVILPEAAVVSPSSDDAVRAWEIAAETGLHPRLGRDGRWYAETREGTIVRAAGAHDAPYQAVLAAAEARVGGGLRQAQARALELLEGLQGASYFPRPREVPDPNPPLPGSGTIRVWDIVKIVTDGQPQLSTIVGRRHILVALEDAAKALIEGTL